MLKKVLSLVLAVCLVLTVLPCAVFAKDELGEIEAAKKAVRASEATLTVDNDMPLEEFLAAVKKVLPEGSTVELSIPKEADYRIYNATSEKDGSIFANITFTCDVYTRQDMYTFKIPMLTGSSAADNADKENLAKDMAAANNVFKGISLDADITAEKILEMAKAAVTHGSQLELTDEFTKVDSTETKKGSAKCFIKFTLNNETDTLKVYNTLKLLETKTEEETKPSEDVKPEDNKTEDNNDGNAETKPAPAIAFEDVADDAYYADAVKWAVEKAITAGTSDTTFSPDQTCTRAQILTFLWRAVGSPAAETENPFSDVTTDDYYYDAAIWAYEMGMVEGDAFEGNTPCTRASTVVYLWKNADAPEVQDMAAFEDVDENADYSMAVAWAVENEVTSGVSETEFAPDTICSRGQIVTFLKRAIG